MRSSRLLLGAVLFFTVFFSFYIYFSERNFVRQQNIALTKSAQIVSEAVWTLFTPATNAYIDQIVHDRRYKSLKIISDADFMIASANSDLRSDSEKFLSRLGLIRPVSISASIYYGDRVIGRIDAEVFNLLIYKYLYACLIYVLIVLSLWFSLQLYRAKAELEQKVKERTRELATNRERLSFAMKAASSGIWDWNFKTQEVYFDDNYFLIAGYKPGAFPQSYEEWEKRLHPEDVTEVMNKLTAYIENSSDFYSVEFRFKKADGQYMWILAQGMIVEWDTDGAPLRFMGTHTDISRNRQIADQLRESEERYHTLFNNSHSVMLLVDPETSNIIDANPAAVEFYGWSREKLLSMKGYELNMLGREGIMREIQKIVEQKQNHFYFKHRLASGEIRDVEVFSGPISYKEKNYLFSIVHDITEKREAEEKLLELNRTLKERVQEEIEKNRKQEEIIHNQKKLADMGNMISAISHQWRQPLNALGLYIQDISDAYAAGEIDGEYVSRFEVQSMDIINHLSLTIDDFRYFYQPDKEMENFKVLDEIYSLLRLTHAQLQSNYVKVNLRCRCTDEYFESKDLSEKPECSDFMSEVRGYKGEFKQVIANIVYNSIDAIRERNARKGVQEGRITVTVEDYGDDVLINICDNGGGIPDSVAPKVFMPYFSTKTDSKGTGIGLYMSKIIIEDHMKGSIGFSNSGEGVCFTVTIPRLRTYSHTC